MRAVAHGFVVALAAATVPFTGSAAAATPSVQTIEAGGATGQVIDLLFVAEGYTDKDQALFIHDVKNVYEALVSAGVYATVRPLLAAHALFVPSNQSGSDHPSLGVERDTAFDSTFDTNGIARLVTANTAKVLSTANAQFWAFDVAILIVNDPRYGGSGGSVPMISVHPQAAAILRHELAHNLAGLADEYTAPYPGYPAGDDEPNVAATAHLAPLPWQIWVESTTAVPTPIEVATGPFTPIGAYEGARYQAKGMFRPAPTCLMRDLADDFCPVCGEAITIAVAADSVMLRGHSPVAGLISCGVGSCPVFAVSTAALPAITVRWWLDGVLMSTGDAWSVDAGLSGSHVLRVDVHDATLAVRNDPASALVESHQWRLEIDARGVPVDAGRRSADVTGDSTTASRADPDADGGGPTADTTTTAGRGGVPRRDSGCDATPLGPRDAAPQWPILFAGAALAWFRWRAAALREE